MKKILAAAVTVLLIVAATPGHGIAERQAERLAIEVCAACHGRDGNSISPLFPRLAGQSAQYLEAQLKSFKERTRADPPAVTYMWGMASQLDDETIKSLANYYALQAPWVMRPTRFTPMSLGQEIYERGPGAQGVPACASCHGPLAQGGATIPRLAGQHPDYLAKQLRFYKARLREDDPVMTAVCANLTAAQIEAVALYASSQ